MERAVYFDGWFPNDHCYHPSLPPRRMAMLDDLEKMRATMLVWAGMGGGVISLPYLEEEALGKVPARYRQYGFVNESEFAAHARAAGIDLFGIVFEAQAWEFAAEVVDGDVVAQNILRDAGERRTVGLREFSQGTGPASWRPFTDYFPGGLTNSAGEQVVDLWDEVASRDLEGNALHAHWVEVSPTGECHFADRNNPVWREYLKAVVRLQIDAGARCIQLDETDTPLTAIRYGGCFCKDCVAEMRRYLLDLPADEVPAELAGVDLATFDYRRWLLGQGFRAMANPQTLPLYEQYVASQQRAIARTFHEIVTESRAYARSKGVELRVAGNFYNCAPYYDPLVGDVDVLVTELRETMVQQPWYFRHGVGLSRGKPLVAVENPYGGVILELHDKLKRGRAQDQFRVTIYEASAMGANMSLPYGSWLGTDVRDSYWVSPPLLAECGAFLEEVDDLITARSPHRTAVVYPVRSIMRNTLDSDQFCDEGRWFAPVENPDARPESYWELLEALSRATKTFDVVVFPDEDLRPDPDLAATLARYDTVVLPDAWAVSPRQHAALVDAVRRGARVVVLGDYGAGLDGAARADFLAADGVVAVADVASAVAQVEGEVLTDFGPEVAVNLQVPGRGGLALHLVNYAFDEESDRAVPLTGLDVLVRSDEHLTTALLHRPGQEPEPVSIRAAGDGVYSVHLPDVTTYAVVDMR